MEESDASNIGGQGPLRLGIASVTATACSLLRNPIEPLGPIDWARLQNREDQIDGPFVDPVGPKERATG